MNKKNYFSALMAMFAMISVMILSSCSHDDYYYNEEKAEQALNDQYAIAFEKAFGKVGPNVDWGFGSKNSSTRAFTRSGVAFNTTINFPGDCPASKFLASVPDGVLSYGEKLSSLGTAYWTPTEINTSAEVYLDHVQAFKITGGEERSKVYLKPGEYDFSNVTFDLCKNADLYLLSGVTLILNNTAASTAKFDIYIAKEAKLIANGDDGLVADAGAHIYNHGTITCSKFEANTTSVLYNSGTMNVNGTMSAESISDEEQGIIQHSYIVNTGTIECTDVVVNGGAVKNDFKWTVSGTTKINSNNSGWINTDHWKTGNYAYVAGSENVINSCYLWVTNDFEMNISSVKGSFKINSGGGVLASNFYGGRDSSTGAVSGPFKIEMAENAVFVVENDAQFESGRGEIDNDKYAYGIFGPTQGGYAVFQAKNIVREASIANTWGAVTYRGHLYVSAETHFAQGNDGMADHKFIFEQDGFSIADNIYAAGFNSGKPNITIEQTPCCPGFQGGTTYRVIAEDLSATEAGDFDFNDVVFDVEPNEARNAAKIVVRAAGGIYKLTVAGQEVHQAFGESANANGLYPMINTNPWNPDVKATLIESYSGDFSSDAAIRNTIKGIEIKVYKPGFEENGIVLEATTGKAACKILVDNTFSVVRERTGIADENTNFHKYVQGTWDNDVNGFWWQKKN